LSNSIRMSVLEDHKDLDSRLEQSWQAFQKSKSPHEQAEKRPQDRLLKGLS